LDYLAFIQRGVDFIEAHLDEHIDPKAVAQAACISPWHFQRIFKAITGETLKGYIRARRMAYALEKLVDPNNKILDIALGAGYESQESFTRAFKARFDMTPNAYRQLGDPRLFLHKVEISKAYLEHLHDQVTLEPVITHRPAATLVGMRTQFYSVDSEKNNIGEQLPPLWAAFLPKLDAIPHRSQGEVLGVITQTSEEIDLLTYHAAAPVTKVSKLPEGMTSCRIPASSYAIFAHKGHPGSIDNTVNYIYSSWLTQSGLQHTFGPDLEIYGADYEQNSNDSVIYYGIPVH